MLDRCHVQELAPCLDLIPALSGKEHLKFGRAVRLGQRQIFQIVPDDDSRLVFKVVSHLVRAAADLAEDFGDLFAAFTEFLLELLKLSVERDQLWVVLEVLISP